MLIFLKVACFVDKGLVIGGDSTLVLFLAVTLALRSIIHAIGQRGPNCSNATAFLGNSVNGHPFVNLKFTLLFKHLIDTVLHHFGKTSALIHSIGCAADLNGIGDRLINFITYFVPTGANGGIGWNFVKPSSIL